MIYLLIRETYIDIPLKSKTEKKGKKSFCVDRLPISPFKSIDGLNEYCIKKGFIKDGEGDRAVYVRNIDFTELKKGIREFFDISFFNLRDRFVIQAVELKE